MPIRKKAGVPRGEEERYREYIARQAKLRKERAEAAAKEEHFVPHEPSPEAVVRHQSEEQNLRKHQVVLGLVLVGLFIFFLSLVWKSRPVIEPIPQDPAQLEWAQRVGQPLEITNSLGMRFRLIPPGVFLMGSPQHEVGRREDETQHKAEIPRAFYMAVTETTQDAYERVMGTNTSFFVGGPDRPVEFMLWEEALRFCNKLSRRENLTPVYEQHGEAWICYSERLGYRLPVEAEWEYACRAGTETAFYAGPSDPPHQMKALLRKTAWFHDNSEGRPRPVGQLYPNGWGLYDMSGNVREWCWDYYDEYPVMHKRRFLGPWSGSGRVVRGGGWFAEPERCRSAARRRWAADLRWNAVGFRCVRTAER